MMTVHAAKGLEFPVVFITGLEENLFPHASAMRENGDSGLEEERRLMYVAITRAKRRLYLSYAAVRFINGQRQDEMPSSFLDEIPQEHKDGIDMAREYLRRARVLVVCGSTVDESVKNDIAVAERLRITATTLDGILTVKGQGRRNE